MNVTKDFEAFCLLYDVLLTWLKILMPLAA
jgi:hypothetical protein